MFRGYIYKTVNLINGKIYIGQSTKIDEYWIKWYLGSGLILLRAVEQYGRENFKKEIIEWIETNQRDLDECEKFWINKFDSRNRLIGYNIREGGSNGALSESSKIKISKTRIERGVAIGDKNPLRIKGGHSEETKELLKEIRGSKVLQFTLEGKFLKEYRSTHDCEGFCQLSISRCCRMIMSSYKRFIFIYKKDFSEEYLKYRIEREKTKNVTGIPDKVKKIDSNGNIIEIFKSMTFCAKKEGISRCKLTNHIKKNIPYKNYYYICHLN